MRSTPDHKILGNNYDDFLRLNQEYLHDLSYIDGALDGQGPSTTYTDRTGQKSHAPWSVLNRQVSVLNGLVQLYNPDGAVPNKYPEHKLIESDDGTLRHSIPNYIPKETNNAPAR